MKTLRKVKQTAAITDYEQLAAHCLALLDEAAAIIPRLAEPRTRASTGPARLNIPLVFLGTAVTSVELIPQLQNIKILDVQRGRHTLRLMETGRRIRDKITALDRGLVDVINTQRSSLAGEALHTYAVAKSLALDESNVALLACVGKMRRSLGRHGRRKKT